MAEISPKQHEMSANFHRSILEQLQASVGRANRADYLALVCLKDYGLTPVLGGSLTDRSGQIYDSCEAPVILYDRSQGNQRDFVLDLLLECLSVDELGEPVGAMTTDQVQRYHITETSAHFISCEGVANEQLRLNDYADFNDIVSKTLFCAEDTAGAVALLYADGRIGEMDDYMHSFVDLGSLGRSPVHGFLDI